MVKKQKGVVTIVLSPDISAHGKCDIWEFKTLMSGECWIFHKYDKDPFPSKVHGHNEETNEVVDAYTGVIYYNRKQVRKMRINQLNELQLQLRKKGFIL